MDFTALGRDSNLLAGTAEGGGHWRAMAGGVSRLDRMIARLTTQRAVLAHAARMIGDLAGPILDIGLGKGRTYDHLRHLLPEREIFAFDRTVHAPADCVPDPDHLFLGEFVETLVLARARLPAPAALAHADFGSEDRSRDGAQAARLGPLIDRLMAPGGLVLSDRRLKVSGWTAVPAVPLQGWPYHVWRAGLPPSC